MWTELWCLWPRPCVGCGRSGGDMLCASCRCLRPRRVMVGEPVHRALALSPYRGPLGRAVLRAKGAPDRALALELARIGARRLAPRLGPTDAIVPVPTTAWRRMRRGFDLPCLLARELGRRLDCPVVHALRRVAGGGGSKALGRAGRAVAVAGSFRSRRPAPVGVLLVDDVLTTGATARRCAEELLGDRSLRVELAVLCAADAPGKSLQNS